MTPLYRRLSRRQFVGGAAAIGVTTVGLAVVAGGVSLAGRARAEPPLIGYLALGFNHNVLSDVVIAESGTVGIFMRDARNNVFRGLQIRDSGEHGIFMAEGESGPGTPTSGNTFMGLVVSNSRQDGIRLQETTTLSNLIMGGQILGYGGQCVQEPSTANGRQAALICR